ncbi:MAG TPA: trypsin-like peptidase domain-containing protein [Thermoguttaceae bacterium]|nr:trypsin-like peptidase domain-containing protein [Thermoguttaceae bacterium]
MPISCHCGSCDARFQVAEKHAGRKVECPKCSGTIAIPALAGDVPAAKPKPAPRKRPPVRDKTKSTDPAQDVSDFAVAALPKIDTGGRPPGVEAYLPSRSSKPVDLGATRKKLWLMFGAAGAVCLAAAIGLVFALSSDDPGTEARSKGSGASETGSSGGSSSAGPKEAVLVLDWPTAERSDAKVEIDGREQTIPKTGEVQYPLDPGSHHVVILRRGYQPNDTQLLLEKGQYHHYQPQWQQSTALTANPPVAPPADGSDPPPVVSGPPPETHTVPKALTFDDWLQDFEEAKRIAAKENKDILIAFDGSDWCNWSRKLADEVFLQKTFRDQADWRFVLVLIDFPKKEAAKAQVEDPERNERLSDQFHVSGYPTIVLTDKEGRPYGFEGYVSGGVDKFMERIVYWQSLRDRFKGLLVSIDMAEGQEKLPAIEKAVDFLEEMDILRYYGPTLDEWYDLVSQLDPKNEQGVLEALFEKTWILRLIQLDEPEEEEVAEIVAELDAWKEDHEFKDPDCAGRLHLIAAAALIAVDNSLDAAKYAKAGLEYHPEDPALLARLEAASEAIGGFSSGTGFVVASDGHILTNQHVIDGAKKIAVRLPDQEEAVTAELVAEDAEKDVALLKINVPTGVRLTPLPISDAQLGRGASVGAFGYAESFSLGTGLKLTTGVISALPNDDSEGMYLLDCRINPGNSGGPLCDSSGNVVGMVTAKSLGGFGVDSYGMALPAEILLTFLREHLPKTRHPVPPRKSATPLPWDEIDRLVGSSVLMVVQ